MNKDITAFPRGSILASAARGESSLRMQKRLEKSGSLVICTSGDKLDTNGFLKVRRHCHHRVCRLLNIFLLKLLDQRSLDRGTTGC